LFSVTDATLSSAPANDDTDTNSDADADVLSRGVSEVRLAKLQALREAGLDPFAPERFDRRTPLAPFETSSTRWKRRRCASRGGSSPCAGWARPRSPI
jgi:hypothetical protein